MPQARNGLHVEERKTFERRRTEGGGSSVELSLGVHFKGVEWFLRLSTI